MLPDVYKRQELNKEKTGVRLEGIEAVNPASGKHVPLFVSDYVLMGYGTGIVICLLYTSRCV